MISAIITEEQAAELNRMVQEKIHGTLFVFCNYMPTVSHGYSEDMKYSIGIQDLYKFAVDSNWLLGQYRKILPESQLWQFNRMRNTIEDIRTLRSVFDHNTNPVNGQMEKDRLDWYYRWVRTVTGKNEPETPNDFKLLNQKLTAMANDLIQYVKKLITCISEQPNRTEVIRIWTDQTLHWYCNNTKTEIYKGQLEAAYVANANCTYQPWELWRKVKKWIHKALFYPIQTQIEELDEQIQGLDDMLQARNPRFNSLREQLPESKWNTMQMRFQKQRDDYQHKKDEAQCEKVALEEQIGDNYVAYFFNNLESQLRKTIERLDADGCAYTLLPQDLMQEDIEYVFGGVPSPEKDF